jgi:hypothetical protein
MLLALIPVSVEKDVYEDPISLCGNIDNVDRVDFNYIGQLKKVKCKDGRILDSF